MWGKDISDLTLLSGFTPPGAHFAFGFSLILTAMLWEHLVTVLLRDVTSESYGVRGRLTRSCRHPWNHAVWQSRQFFKWRRRISKMDTQERPSLKIQQTSPAHFQPHCSIFLCSARVQSWVCMRRNGIFRAEFPGWPCILFFACRVWSNHLNTFPYCLRLPGDWAHSPPPGLLQAGLWALARFNGRGPDRVTVMFTGC